jgi:hypothetical protein
MKYVVPTFLSLLFVAPAFTQSILNLSQTPEEVLAKSIKYHDPAGEWGKFPIQLQLTETRPNGPDRKTTLTIDIPNETFAIDQLRDGHQLYSEINLGVCSFKLDGNSEISEAELEKYRLNCDRTKTLRDYYTYLWGLPMKLKDPGAILPEKIEPADFAGIELYMLRITYSPEVGKDIWDFFLDATSYEIIAYRFFHDESKNDGEFIFVEGETQVGQMRLPKTRKWQTNDEAEYLGSDILDSGTIKN